LVTELTDIGVIGNALQPAAYARN